MNEMTLDKRVHAYRDDIANIELEGKVSAREFVAGEKYQAGRGISPLYSKPEAAAIMTSCDKSAPRNSVAAILAQAISNKANSRP